MKKISLFLLVFMGIVYYTTASKGINPPKKFGDIDSNNLKMTVFAPDSSASAVYIFDWGYSHINFNTSEVELFTHVRIKILNSDGFSRGNVEIPHGSHSSIMKLKAATYNMENGEMVTTKVDKSMIFNEKVTDTHQKTKISFPDVREGSIIEYSYRRSGGDIIHLVPWSFQTTIPVMYSEYNLRIPNALKYKIISSGYEILDVSTKRSVTEQGSVNSDEYHWVMRDVPALKREPFMPNIDNYYSRLEFELESVVLSGNITKDYTLSWSGYEKDLLDDTDFYLMAKKWSFLKDSVARITQNKKGIDKIRVIRNFITRHVKWNEKERKFTSDKPKKIYDDGKGNSADINFMFIGLLRLADIEAHPVILSTRNNGIIRYYTRPVASQYNYTIAYTKLGDQEYLLDATDPSLPLTLLPARCINGKGRMIELGASKWVQLDAKEKTKSSIISQMKIDEEGNLTGNINISTKGYAARNRRDDILSKGMDKYIQDFKKSKGDWSIDNFEIQNRDDANKPLVEKIQCSIEGRVEDVGDILILNPLIGSKWEENPFQGEKRVYPIDFIANQFDRFLLNFAIPEDYTVDEIPKSLRIQTPDKGISYSYRVSVNNEFIQVLSSLNINKPVFLQTEYKELQQFFELVREKQSEQIVLKKTDL